MSLVQSGEALLGFKSDAIYEVVGQYPAGLCLDVGAADGRSTTSILKASPDARVVAFEPFPGNFPFFDKTHGADRRVMFVKKAVSNHSRPQRFYVSRTVQNGVGSWKGMDGYSSVGQLVEDTHPNAAAAIEVETCRLDDLVHERVRFLKIDVQGAEYDLLDGARTLFDRHGVDLVYIEFSGDKRILDFLAERQYAFFDTEYQIVLSRIEREAHHWKIARQGNVSTGAKVGFGWPTDCPRDLLGFSDFVETQRKKLGHVQTDLVCVAPAAMEEFENACVRARTAFSTQ